MGKTKINISIDNDLLRDLDDYCDKNYMNRSWVISQSILQTITHQKIVDSMVNISIALKNVSEKGTLDDDTLKNLETFETLAKMYIGK